MPETKLFYNFLRMPVPGVKPTRKSEGMFYDIQKSVSKLSEWVRERKIEEIMKIFEKLSPDIKKKLLVALNSKPKNSRRKKA